MSEIKEGYISLKNHPPQIGEIGWISLSDGEEKKVCVVNDLLKPNAPCFLYALMPKDGSQPSLVYATIYVSEEAKAYGMGYDYWKPYAKLDQENARGNDIFRWIYDIHEPLVPPSQ